MRILFAAMAAMSLLPSRAGAECKPTCSDIVPMQKELWGQEFLQARFKKYLDYDIIPSPEAAGESMVEAMQHDAAAALSRYEQSPAGGGQKGNAAPAAGTAPDCTIKLYLPNHKTVPYDDAAYRKTHKCWEAEFLLAHEQQHVADCKGGAKFDEYLGYAASDVRAYGVGVRRLRKLIADTAKSCNWRGSVNKDGSENVEKKNPVDKQPEPVVPTPADVDEIINALSSAGRHK